jgi:hypothetical protein
MTDAEKAALIAKVASMTNAEKEARVEEIYAMAADERLTDEVSLELLEILI